jgi:hypothetical protein
MTKIVIFESWMFTEKYNLRRNNHKMCNPVSDDAFQEIQKIELGDDDDGHATEETEVGIEEQAVYV